MKRRRRKKFHMSILFLLCFFLLFLFFSFLERQLLPPLKEISHMQCKALANQIIDVSAFKILEKMDMSNSLLLVSEESESYTANTAKINQFCALFSTEITDSLTELPDERISIPLGAATNMSLFANMGPKIPFTLVPMGAATVDYESEFLSVGINQINYKIWLDISIDLKIVNPLYQEVLTLERKIMLVDFVFSGKVPEHYFQMSSPNEYLLTE